MRYDIKLAEEKPKNSAGKLSKSFMGGLSLGGLTMLAFSKYQNQLTPNLKPNQPLKFIQV